MPLAAQCVMPAKPVMNIWGTALQDRRRLSCSATALHGIMQGVARVQVDLVHAPRAVPYQDSDNFSTTSFLAKTREHSSQRFLSGSMVSL